MLKIGFKEFTGNRAWFAAASAVVVMPVPRDIVVATTQSTAEFRVIVFFSKAVAVCTIDDSSKDIHFILFLDTPI